MKKITQIILIILVTFCLLLPLLSSNMNIEHFKDNKPTLDLFDYFEGNTRGWGMVQDRNGNPKKQFTVDIKGYLNETGNMVLEEDFVWSDGEKTRRVWTLKQEKPNHYTGTAPDIVVEANGISAGNAFNLNYVMNLPVGDKTYKISFDDWMFLQPDGVLINRVKMSKFGFSVGEVTISFKKL